MAESPKAVDGLGREDLRSLLIQVLTDIARLKTENAELRTEIARLKGLKGRPDIKPNKPSGMQAATSAAALAAPEPTAKTGRNKRRRGSKRAKLTITESKVVKAPNVAPGARFKGYRCRGRLRLREFVVQDLVIATRTTP